MEGNPSCWSGFLNLYIINQTKSFNVQILSKFLMLLVEMKWEGEMNKNWILVNDERNSMPWNDEGLQDSQAVEVRLSFLRSMKKLSQHIRSTSKDISRLACITLGTDAKEKIGFLSSFVSRAPRNKGDFSAHQNFTLDCLTPKILFLIYFKLKNP